MSETAKKVLVADDERTLLQLVAFNLRMEGYEVITAEDGKEALTKIREEHPDVVVLDVMMPHLDGFDVLRELRADPETQDLPVIMLTALSQDEHVLKGWEYGVDCYLTKPFNPIELLSMVKRLTTLEEDSVASL
ncbi:MAG TPA: response regulator [Armatimonadetes bacterium]|nr:response regulator [Armatimonadota bacterium]